MILTVFGEILWDIFGDEKKIGGAPFNFAAHAAREGARVRFVSAVGNDSLGDEALAACRQMDIPTDYIARADQQTGRCNVTLKDGIPDYDLSGDMAYDHIVLPEGLLAQEHAEELGLGVEDTPVAENQTAPAEENEHEPTALYFGTLAQRGAQSRAALRQLMREGSFDEVFVDINIRQHYYSAKLLDESIGAATILKLSRDDAEAFSVIEELKETMDEAAMDNADPDGPEAEDADNLPLIIALMERYPNLHTIVLTLDADGAAVYERNGHITRSRKPDCEVVSTVGAGDSFAASFLVNYLNELEIDECLERATSLAEFVCGHTEAVPLYPMDDVRRWRAIYRLLNMVNTEVYDCGELCGCACCLQRGEENLEENEEMGIFLFPGEHRILRESEQEEKWLSWEALDKDEVEFPSSWTGPVYFVNCQEPPRCPRAYRPLQCRTFPLKPVIDENGVLEMIWDDAELPYTCPIIEKNMPIHDSFYKATYTVWKHLLEDKRIMDLVLLWS